jgi:hypothetical protein
MEEIIEAIEDGADLAKAADRFYTLPSADRERLLDRVVKLRSTQAAQFLILLSARISDKKLQKVIKKDIFRLRTVGIKVEEPQPTGPTALKKTEVIREARASMSNYDEEQTRVVLAAFEVKKREFVFNQAVMHFSKGLVGLSSYTVAKDQLDHLFHDFASHLPLSMVLSTISAPYAGYVIREGSEISGEHGENATTVARFLMHAEGDVRAPQDIYHLPFGDDTIDEPVEQLLTRPIFQPFTLQWTGMEEDRRKMDDIIKPSIVLPPYILEERRALFLQELSVSERMNAVTGPFKRMMEDSAYLLYRLGDTTACKRLVGQLKDEQRLDGLLRYFVEKTLGKLEEKAAPQPGVIIDPYATAER